MDNVCSVQPTERHLRIVGSLALILLFTLTACGTSSDSPSVAPAREAATPIPELSAGTEAPSPTPTAVPTTTTPAGLPDIEREALIALYDATGGDDWKISSGWLGDGPLDRWLRVATDEDGRVTEVDLSANQLSGEIPSELSNLPNLRLLYISDNDLTGALPQRLTSLAGLETFHFHNNPGLCAPIDEAFQAWLKEIAEVRGSSCAPEDSPEDREVLAKLYDALKGENWTNNTNWMSERPIREWHGVTSDASGRVVVLILGLNELTGAIPKELGGLSNLQRLELENNKLTGEMPPELGSLGNLEILLLGFNQLTGEIPPELGSLSNLETLTLSFNQFTGEIPPELSKLSNLDTLLIRGNQMTGEVPTDLGSLSNLRRLELDTNQLTGEIPEELGNLSNLEYLRLDRNSWSGCIPAKLKDVPDSDLHSPAMPPYC